MKVKFTLSVGYGKGQEEIMDFDDDITEEELEQIWQDWSNNYIDGGFKILKGE